MTDMPNDNNSEINSGELTIKKRGRKSYVFYPDSIVIKRKDKIRRRILISDIDKIFYNPKMSAKQIIEVLISPRFACYDINLRPSKAFDIFLKGNGRKCVRLFLSPDQYAEVMRFLKLKEIGLPDDWV